MSEWNAEHLDIICRTCMSNDGFHFIRHKYEGSKRTIEELLNELIFKFHNKVDANDSLPKMICKSCLEKLSLCNEFQEMCLQTDAKLRNILYTKHNAIINNHLSNEDPLKEESLSDDKGFVSRELNEANCSKRLPIFSGTNEAVPIIAEINKNYRRRVASAENTIYTVPLPNICNEPSVDTETSSAGNIRKDYEHLHKNGKVSSICLKCNKSYKDECSLKEHMLSFHAEKCSKTAVYDDEKTINEIKGETAFKRPFQCQTCKRVFVKQSYMRKHQISHACRLRVKENKCINCGQRFRSSVLLNHHLLLHKLATNEEGHEESKDPIISLKPCICDICQKAFKHPWTLRHHHIRVHTDQQAYLCSECGKAFNTSSNLQQHILRHSDEKRYECPECPKRFSCFSDMASHKKVHKKLRPHICDICGAAFGRPYHLKKHKMHHTGEKPYKCDQCEKKFVTGDHLRRHLRTHTGEKPYKCKYCEKAFMQSNDLMKHLRVHLGENVYRCEFCPKGFPFASGLRDHLTEHKNEDDATRQRNKSALLAEEERLKIQIEHQNSEAWNNSV